MDRLSNYRILIKKILTEYHNWASGSSKEDHENSLVFDEDNDQYLWLHMGWQGKKRIKGINIHVRIKNEKVWIEEDWTEEGIATELVKAGIGTSDIVLAFYPPTERALTLVCYC
ncbi:XisI protein [Iningainema tapete]|uniref:XisI protein n=1 Tax=Iningainema tapete BLCC-T55 TaxID=2748662 RepID=A0A8J6XUB5_9CYAN|nr:XisI protein [Iningainema tapete]MBD2776107.1 XisI protein [Iningainema tapete BLCC-T55]